MQMHLHSFQWKWRSGYDPRLHAFPWQHLLTTLSITMRAPTVEPNHEIRAARRHMEHTTFGNVRIHRKTSQIICRWPFGTPDDLRAQARHPCHCPTTDEIADEIAAASLLYMPTSKLSSTPQKKTMHFTYGEEILRRTWLIPYHQNNLVCPSQKKQTTDYTKKEPFKGRWQLALAI